MGFLSSSHHLADAQRSRHRLPAAALLTTAKNGRPLHPTQEGDVLGEDDEALDVLVQKRPRTQGSVSSRRPGFPEQPLSWSPHFPPRAWMPSSIRVPSGPWDPCSPALLKCSHADMCFMIQNKPTELILTEQAALSLAPFSPWVLGVFF